MPFIPPARIILPSRSSSLLFRQSCSGCSSIPSLSMRRRRTTNPPYWAAISSRSTIASIPQSSRQGLRNTLYHRRHNHHQQQRWHHHLYENVASSRQQLPQQLRRRSCGYFSTLPTSSNNTTDSDSDDDDITNPPNNIKSSSCPHHHRLSSIRNVGIFAHVDAGKTTVTERMLALSGIVRHPGSVDGGDTVTDYLPAERERGITIQSAAVGFEWRVPPPPPPAPTSSSSSSLTSNSAGSRRKGGGVDRSNGRTVSINLVDTPGHVDFSVEVHRSVAVLDGAILVVDAVAGAQAQTETVWRAIRNTDANTSISGGSSNSSGGSNSSKGDDASDSKNNNMGGVTRIHGTHAHEPLPALMFVNKMDREGADFQYAIQSVKSKLRGSNPIPIQIPLYRTSSSSIANRSGSGVIVANADHGEYIGLVDLIHMRAIIYPANSESLSVEEAAPTVIPLLGRASQQQHQQLLYELSPSVLEAALNARRELIVHLANVDEIMEDSYLMAMMNQEDDDEETAGSCSIIETISTEEIQSSLRRMTLARRIMPTMCGAALRGLGVEPVLDCVAEYLPCPLDRLPPQLSLLGNNASSQTLGGAGQKCNKPGNSDDDDDDAKSAIRLGHPLHQSTLAYVFKVLHMKGRGGSGDGRVAFARVYSGTLKARDSVRVISPGMIGSSMSENEGGKKKPKHPVERIGGMLELSGGTFGNLPDGICLSGDVCALVGLKGVVTGDTLLSTSVANNGGTSDSKKKDAKSSKVNDVHWKQYMEGVHLSGLTSPKPVLTLRVEANSVSEQTRLSAALAMLAVEDPSLVIEETPTTTLISGLGELHMEIILDRLRREFGLVVRTGKPAVSYRETISLKDGEEAETDGLVEYDRTVGTVRLQGAVQLCLVQSVDKSLDDSRLGVESCFPPNDPVVTLSSEIRTFFNLDPKPTSNESEHKYPQALQAILSGVRGSLKRGRLGPYPLANIECHVMSAHSELSSPDTLPGAMRAAAANAATTLLESLAKDGKMVILEPKMNVEIWVPSARVGDVLSDLTGRRGTVGDVAMADEVGGGSGRVKSMVRAEVPLVEILGYANSLRSLTGGEGAFSAEYKGHAPQDGM